MIIPIFFSIVINIWHGPFFKQRVWGEETFCLMIPSCLGQEVLTGLCFLSPSLPNNVFPPCELVLSLESGVASVVICFSLRWKGAHWLRQDFSRDLQKNQCPCFFGIVNYIWNQDLKNEEKKRLCDLGALSVFSGHHSYLLFSYMGS